MTSVLRRSRVRALGALAGAVVLVGAGAGVTYAATGSAPTLPGQYAIACADSHHTLRLVDTRDRCPSGFSRVALGYAPTALTVDTLRTSRKVATDGFSFTADCHNDLSGHFADLVITGTKPYVVQGSDVIGGNGALYTPTGPSMAGAGQITYAASAGNLTTTLSMLNDGGATGSLVVVQGGHTIAVTFALFSYNEACSVQAQLTPSG